MRKRRMRHNGGVHRRCKLPGGCILLCFGEQFVLNWAVYSAVRTLKMAL